MKVAVVGYGKMGREVEAVLRERNHEAVPVGRGAPFPVRTTVAIDFTQADAVLVNTKRALDVGARCVIGTTGWTEKLGELGALVKERDGGVVYAANFSVGVNLFYRIVKEAAALLARFPEYDPYILERHHRMKKDAPSGTAKTLAGLLEKAGGPRKRATTSLEGALPEDAFHVAAVRAGGIVGEHVVGFDSGGDEILLEHRARSRRGFAAGAVLAAEWIADRKGLHTFEAVLEELTQQPRRMS